jgi:hypothetical protein
MDLKFYEELLDKAILKVYSNKITVDKKGIFEWSKNEDGSISHRSIKKLHVFKSEKKTKPKLNSEPKVVYLTFENSFFISKLYPENTFDMYTSGGGMTKRYKFKKTDDKIEKIEEILASYPIQLKFTFFLESLEMYLR